MAQTDLLKRYLDAGLAFTQLTQQRAESIVRDLVKAGEVQASEATKRRDELVERSRQNTEKLLETVRKEVNDQIRSLGLATQSDVQALRLEIQELRKASKASAATKKAVTTPPKTKADAPAKKAPAAKRNEPAGSTAKKASAAKA
jgi:polyhydroxyalkanoate synthesis regulator phasin